MAQEAEDPSKHSTASALASVPSSLIAEDAQLMEVDAQEEQTIDPIVAKAKQLSLEDLSGVFQFDKMDGLTDSLMLRVGGGQEL